MQVHQEFIEKEKEPGTIIDEPVMGIDWMPTFSKLTGSNLSENKIDGKDIWPLITQREKKSPHDELYFYYRENELHAVRSGDWKLYFPRTYRSLNGKPGGTGGMPVKYVKKLEDIGERARKDLGDKLTSRIGKGVREIGIID